MTRIALVRIVCKIKSNQHQHQHQDTHTTTTHWIRLVPLWRPLSRSLIHFLDCPTNTQPLVDKGERKTKTDVTDSEGLLDFFVNPFHICTLKTHDYLRQKATFEGEWSCQWFRIFNSFLHCHVASCPRALFARSLVSFLSSMRLMLHFIGFSLPASACKVSSHFASCPCVSHWPNALYSTLQCSLQCLLVLVSPSFPIVCSPICDLQGHS